MYAVTEPLGGGRPKPNVCPNCKQRSSLARAQNKYKNLVQFRDQIPGDQMIWAQAWIKLLIWSRPIFRFVQKPGS